MYLLALDAGTGAGRCLLYDDRGRAVARAYQPWDYCCPPELAPLGKEFDADAFWGILAAGARQCLVEAGVAPGQVAAVSATSQRQGMVFLDDRGAAVYAGPNLDLRGLIGGSVIDQAHGAAIYATTGHLPSLLMAPARLAWFRDCSPATYAAIALALPIDAWLGYRLCGEAASPIASAGECGLLDLSARGYDETLLERLGLRTDLLPPLVEAGMVIGRLTRGAAEATGLVAGTPVVAGGPDTQCGLLGMGLTEPGELGVVAGSTMPLQQTTPAPVLHPEAALWAGCHLLPNLWVAESNAGDAGNAYAWLAALLSGAALRDEPAGEDSYAALEARAAGTAPGSDGALAYLGPSPMDMRRLKAALGGLVHPLPVGLMGIGPGQLARAALENVAFAVRANVDQLEALTGARAPLAHLCGGLSRSRLLREMLAAVLQRPVRPQEAPEATALGAAICAATGAGRYPDLATAARAMARPCPPVEPDPRISAEYAGLYAGWREGYRALDRLGELDV
jgi:autoinducer 2 (AI-2) kinase